MAECLLCEQAIRENLQLKEIIIWQAIYPRQICQWCKATFELISPGVGTCKTCSGVSELSKCLDCLAWEKIYPDDLMTHTSLYNYNESLATWFSHYKFLGDYRLRQTFAKQLAQYFKSQKNCLVVPIPLGERRQAERGFNQVEGFLSAAGIDFTPLLQKTVALEAQSSKTKTERLKTPQMFSLNRHEIEALPLVSVILVDDVYTTGRTLYHARDCLRESGISRIKSFSLAR